MTTYIGALKATQSDLIPLTFEKHSSQLQCDKKIIQFFGCIFEIESRASAIDLKGKGHFPLSKNLEKYKTLLTKCKILMAARVPASAFPVLTIVPVDRKAASFVTFIPMKDNVLLVKEYRCQLDQTITPMGRELHVRNVIPLSTNAVDVAEIQLPLSEVSDEVTSSTSSVLPRQDNSNMANENERVRPGFVHTSYVNYNVANTIPFEEESKMRNSSLQPVNRTTHTHVGGVKRKSNYRQIPRGAVEQPGVVDTLIAVVGKLFSRSKTAAKVSPSSSVAINNADEIKANAKIEYYQARLDLINMFLDNHPKLKKLCEQQMVIDIANIAVPTDLSAGLDPRDEYDRVTLAKLKANNREHIFNEFMFFIERNTVIKEAFMTHIQGNPTPYNEFQALIPYQEHR